MYVLYRRLVGRTYCKNTIFVGLCLEPPAQSIYAVKKVKLSLKIILEPPLIASFVVVARDSDMEWSRSRSLGEKKDRVIEQRLPNGWGCANSPSAGFKFFRAGEGATCPKK